MPSLLKNPSQTVRHLLQRGHRVFQTIQTINKRDLFCSYRHSRWCVPLRYTKYKHCGKW